MRALIAEAVFPVAWATQVPKHELQARNPRSLIKPLFVVQLAPVHSVLSGHLGHPTHLSPESSQRSGVSLPPNDTDDAGLGLF